VCDAPVCWFGFGLWVGPWPSLDRAAAFGAVGRGFKSPRARVCFRVATTLSGKVALGGTFALIHRGHVRLFDEAAALGVPVTVGVTVDPLIRKYHDIPGFEDRCDNVRRFFYSRYGVVADVVGLRDHYGPVASDAGYTHLVTSEESLPYSCELSGVRVGRGMGALRIVVVDTVRAFDGRPVSTTRILGGEIDSEGRPTCVFRRDYKW
jgi:pantetheine-phosphate adenylyltransferase